jgi:hypothetical protein
VANETLKFVLFLIPQFIVFIFIVLLPFLRFFLVPLLLGGGGVAGRVGGTACVRIDLHGGGTAVSFIQKDTISVMTLDAGHSILLLRVV